MQMNERIDDIIARKLAGEASGEDMRMLEDWLAADAGNRAEYERVSKTWLESGNIFNDIQFNTSAAWDKVTARIISETQKTSKPKTIMLPVWSRYTIGAAAILIIGFFMFRPAQQNGMQLVVAETTNKDLILPDNSHVTLRKGGKLSYPKSFAANERNITLEGEAFFEVTRNEHKPFVIDAGSVSVKVLGTSFDVNCDAATAKVTVATGKVQVTAKNNASKYIILTKGEHGIYSGNTLTEGTMEGTNYLFWKTGMLQYDNKSLSYIATELTMYYDHIVVIDDNMPVDKRNQLINISFKNQSIEQILNELCLVSGCSWHQMDNKYVITAK